MKPASLKFYDSFIRWNQWLSLAIMVVSLPLSNQFMSIAGFWMAAAWLLDLHYDHLTGKPLAHRFRAFTSQPSAWLLTGIFVLLCIGMLWTENIKYGLWDLRIKLPLLFMPLVLTGFRPIQPKYFTWIIILFNGSLMFGALHCLGVYYRLWGEPFTNVREISHFISHIRFSLLLVMGLCALVWLVWQNWSHVYWATAAAMIYIFFLWIIESMTGFSVLLAILAIATLKQILGHSNSLLRYASLVILVLTLAGVSFYILHSANTYFTPKVEYSSLPEKSAGGEPYFHVPSNSLLENGHYVWRNIAWNELFHSWSQRSSIHPDSTDARNQPLKGTLIRFLTSKGLTKDSVGVWSLSDDEVKMIESGKTSYLSGTRKGLTNRLDKIFFEIDNYRNGGDPGGNSVTQRVEFWKCASSIIAANPITGVGTGDVNDSFKRQYIISQSPLDEPFRLRSHNQYLTYMVGLGIPGGIFFIIAVLYPLSRRKYRKDLLYVAFAIISLMSFLTEDSLETQAGVTFFTFFSCLLLFIKPGSEDKH